MNLSILTILILFYNIFFISFHPLVMGSSIIIQALMISMILSNKMLFSWFSFLIFIVFLGGILMLFSYIISMIDMKDFFFNKKKSFMVSIFFILFFMLFINFSSFLSMMSLKNNFFLVNYQNTLFIPFSSSFKISIFMMLFLLLVMLVVIFLIESSKGSMRSM